MSMERKNLPWDSIPWKTCKGCREFHTFWSEECGRPELPSLFLQWVREAYVDTGYTQAWTRDHLKPTHPEIYTAVLLMGEEE